MNRYQWHIFVSFSFLFRLPPIWRILKIFVFPWSKDYRLIYVVFLPSTYSNTQFLMHKHLSLKLWWGTGRLYQYHYFTVLSLFLNSSFIAFFYLSLSCWTGRQQYKAKHVSRWKCLHYPLSECVLFLLQLHTAQRHIHETTHNFGYFEGMGKTSNKSKTRKKSRSRNAIWNCFLTVFFKNERLWCWKVILDVIKRSTFIFLINSFK